MIFHRSICLPSPHNGIFPSFFGVRVASSLPARGRISVLYDSHAHSLRRGQSHFRYIAEIDALLRLPQVVVVLHRQPTLGRAAERFGKPQRHLGTYAARAAQDSMKR